MLAGVWGSWCAGLAVRSAGPMSVLVRIRAKNEMCVYELPYMESVMCECLLASGRALVTPKLLAFDCVDCKKRPVALYVEIRS